MQPAAWLAGCVAGNASQAGTSNVGSSRQAAGDFDQTFIEFWWFAFMRAGVRPECAHARQSAPGLRPCASECSQSDRIYSSKQCKGTSENQNSYILKEQTTEKVDAEKT